MARRFLMVAICVFPILAMGSEAQKLASLEAKLAAHYAKLLAAAKAEDADARKDSLPEKYATQEEILKKNEAAFEDYMIRECMEASSENACKIKLITNRLAILDYHQESNDQ